MLQYIIAFLVWLAFSTRVWVNRHDIAEKIADLALNSNHSNYGKILPLENL
jgi:hypothetical protein